MERELEVKIMSDNIGEIEKEIKELAGELDKDIKQINIIFKGNEKLGGYLRVRLERDVLTQEIFTEFTFKKHIENDKAKENIEYNVDIKYKDIPNLVNILENMGFYESGRFEKARRSYKYNGITFDFDEVTYKNKKINNLEVKLRYVEVEAKNEKEIEEIKEQFKDKNIKTSTKSIIELLNIEY